MRDPSDEMEIGAFLKQTTDKLRMMREAHSCMAIEVAGKQYSSISMAAEKTGIDAKVLRQHQLAGTLYELDNFLEQGARK